VANLRTKDLENVKFISEIMRRFIDKLEQEREGEEESY